MIVPFPIVSVIHDLRGNPMIPLILMRIMPKKHGGGVAGRMSYER